MSNYLLMGVLLGLSAGLAPGPLLTLVITETLQSNVKAGIKVALAPLITDLPISLISVLVLTTLSNSNVILGIISIVGACFVFYIGYDTLMSQRVDTTLGASKAQSLIKGVLANALSPHPYLFWISVGSPIMTKALKINTLSAVQFLLGFYIVLIGSKIGLALAVSGSKAALTSNVYIYTMRILGVALGGLAIMLLMDGLRLLNTP